ncbi:MAG TPA: DMT family transporter [Epulopiscium sp.]|nr:DMT family transporter [Candidatus Epulonipiscium sp.]
MKKQIKADLFLVAITAIWGLSFPLMRNILSYISYIQYLAVRFLIAGVILSIIFCKKLQHISIEEIKSSFIIGSALAGSLGFTVYALYFTKASNVAIITGLNIVTVPIISSLILNKKPNLNSLLSIIIALIGLFIISGGLDLSFNIGDLFALICALCITSQIIFIDKFTEKYDPIILGVLQINISAMIFCVLWIINGVKPIILNTTVITTLIITGVFGTALAFTGQTLVQKYTSPTHASIIFIGEPVFGAMFSLIIPDVNGITEKLTLSTIVGGTLIIAAIIISEVKFKVLKK